MKSYNRTLIYEDKALYEELFKIRLQILLGKHTTPIRTTIGHRETRDGPEINDKWSSRIAPLFANKKRLIITNEISLPVDDGLLAKYGEKLKEVF